MQPTRRVEGLFDHMSSLNIDSIQYAAVDRLEKAIESIQSTIEDQGGSLVVKMKVKCYPIPSESHTHDYGLQPKAVSETEEQDLAQLMAKAGQENAEVSGDEDEEEAM